MRQVTIYVLDHEDHYISVMENPYKNIKATPKKEKTFWQRFKEFFIVSKKELEDFKKRHNSDIPSG